MHYILFNINNLIILVNLCLLHEAIHTVEKTMINTKKKKRK